MSTSSSAPKPSLQKDSIIGGWKVIRKLGSGGFGSVYEVEKDNVRAAMKTEFIDEKRTETLRNEVIQLRVMQWSPYFCRLYMACRMNLSEEEKVNVMVMSLVGRPLSRLRRMTPDCRFTRSTAIRLSKQCLEALRDLHKTGILHRDVKGGNFAWSPEKRVYLLDLGFCRRFLEVHPDGRVAHRPARKKAPFLGTSKYVSLNVHNRIEQGRRDDLWGWLYMLVEFIVGRLIWRNDSDKETAVKKTKIGSNLLRKCPVEMFVIYDHIRALLYDSKPDYDLIQKQLDKICERCNIRVSDPYDWEEDGAYFEQFRGKSETERDMSTKSFLLEEEEDEDEIENNKDNSEARNAPPLIELSSDGSVVEDASEVDDNSSYHTDTAMECSVDLNEAMIDMPMTPPVIEKEEKIRVHLRAGNRRIRGRGRRARCK